MRCLRRAASKTKWDKTRNEEIRVMIRTSAIMNYIPQQQIKKVWSGMRLLPSQPALQACNSRCSGNRVRGRPWWWWIDDVSNILCIYGIVSCWSVYFSLKLNVRLGKWDTTPWYMYTPTLLTNLLYIHYLHMVWLCSKINLCPFSGSIHIYIYMSHDYLTIWLVTIIWEYV